RAGGAEGMKRLTTLLSAGLVLASLGCAPEEEGRNDREPTDTSHPVDTPGGQLKASQVMNRCETSRIGPALLRRLTRGELQATVEDVFPEIRGEWRGTRLSADPASVLGFSNDAAALLVGSQTASELLRTAEDVATLVTREGTLSAVLPCASSGDEACAGEFVNQYGLRLFRRPLTDAERAEYVGLFNSVASESDFATGIKWTLVALLQSPYAVYRSEL